jgi:hypothetical protein
MLTVLYVFVIFLKIVVLAAFFFEKRKGRQKKQENNERGGISKVCVRKLFCFVLFFCTFGKREKYLNKIQKINSKISFS